MTISVRRLDLDDQAELERVNSFDHPVRGEAARRFLTSSDHHILLAYDDDCPVGFVTGVELTHPDKGTEMFLYELAVDESHRRRGVGAALVNGLRELARERSCYGMWVLTEDDNVAALATYRSAGAGEPSNPVLFEWALGRKTED